MNVYKGEKKLDPLKLPLYSYSYQSGLNFKIVIFLGGKTNSVPRANVSLQVSARRMTSAAITGLKFLDLLIRESLSREFTRISPSQLSPSNFHRPVPFDQLGPFTVYPLFFPSALLFIPFCLDLPRLSPDIVWKFADLRPMNRISDYKSVRTLSQLGRLTLWASGSSEKKRMELYGARWES